jgi:hypothetical protein
LRLARRFCFIEAHEVNVLISEPMPRVGQDTQRFQAARSAFWGRLFFLSFALVLAGWLWPYELTSLPTHLGSLGWLLGWFTVLVIIGVACGYTLCSRWSILVAPLALYIGGVLHWIQFESGLQYPDWQMFALVSGLAFGVLLITAGAAAGISSRVITAPKRGRPAEGVRMSAAVAALLGLVAITAVYVLPAPFIGILLGLGALLAGFGLMEEEQVNFRERLLAIFGMIVGLTAAGTQLYSLWTFLKELI